jgi:AraC family transcriptional regulator
MTGTTTNLLTPVRFEEGKPLRVAGLQERYTFEEIAGIPAQWQRFGPLVGSVPGRVGHKAYCVCRSSQVEGTFDYLCGVEVSGGNALPPQLELVDIPTQRYAVFFHRDHVSTIHQTFSAIWNQWLPESGFTVLDTPNFDLYDERFDPRTGTSGVEVWVPVEKAG